MFLPNSAQGREKQHGVRRCEASEARAASVGLAQGRIERQRPLTALRSLAAAAVPSLAPTSACWSPLLLPPHPHPPSSSSSTAAGA